MLVITTYHFKMNLTIYRKPMTKSHLCAHAGSYCHGCDIPKSSLGYTGFDLNLLQHNSHRSVSMLALAKLEKVSSWLLYPWFLQPFRESRSYAYFESLKRWSRIIRETQQIFGTGLWALARGVYSVAPTKSIYRDPWTERAHISGLGPVHFISSKHLLGFQLLNTQKYRLIISFLLASWM